MQELDKIIKELKTRKLEELEKDFIKGSAYLEFDIIASEVISRYSEEEQSLYFRDDSEMIASVNNVVIKEVLFEGYLQGLEDIKLMLRGTSGKSNYKS